MNILAIDTSMQATSCALLQVTDSDTCTEIVNTKRLLEIVIPTTLWQQRQERGQNLVKLSEELKAKRREI